MAVVVERLGRDLGAWSWTGVPPLTLPKMVTIAPGLVFPKTTGPRTTVAFGLFAGTSEDASRARVGVIVGPCVLIVSVSGVDLMTLPSASSTSTAMV